MKNERNILVLSLCALVYVVAGPAVCFAEFAEGAESIQIHLMMAYTILGFLFALGAVYFVVKDVLQSRKLR